VDAVADVMDKAAGTSHLSCKLLILKVHQPRFTQIKTVQTTIIVYVAANKLFRSLAFVHTESANFEYRQDDSPGHRT